MIRDTPVCKAGFEGGDYNSAKAGGSCKIVKPGRYFCCAAFNLAVRSGRITIYMAQYRDPQTRKKSCRTLLS